LIVDYGETQFSYPRSFCEEFSLVHLATPVAVCSKCGQINYFSNMLTSNAECKPWHGSLSLLLCQRVSRLKLLYNYWYLNI